MVSFVKGLRDMLLKVKLGLGLGEISQGVPLTYYNLFSISIEPVCINYTKD